MTKHKITILGLGSWGMALGMLLLDNNQTVTIWDIDSKRLGELNKTKKFDLLPWISIPKDIKLSDNLNEACMGSDILVFAIPSHAVRNVALKIKDLDIKPELIISVAKGIEDTTFLHMTEIINEVTGFPLDKIFALSGPSHAEEVSKKIATTIVLAGKKSDNLFKLQNLFTNEYFRVYTTEDIKGVEIGGAVKNIIAIAVGISDGLHLGDNTRAAIITRGLLEMSRLVVSQGADRYTVYGLSGLGDLVVTCTSKHSRNRHLGERIGKGEKGVDIIDSMNMVAEGFVATKSVYKLAQKFDISMPLVTEVYNIIYKGKYPMQAVKDLMAREPKSEDWS